MRGTYELGSVVVVRRNMEQSNVRVGKATARVPMPVIALAHSPLHWQETGRAAASNEMMILGIRILRKD